MPYYNAIDGDDWTAPDEAQARVHDFCISGALQQKHGDKQKIRGPGRELNPGPPPDDNSPKKESYY
jgi:hypothetical protein